MTPKLILAALIAAAVVAGCTSSDDADSTPTGQQETATPATTGSGVEDESPTASADEDTAASASEVTVASCGVEFTYAEPPERILATDTGAVETLVALGVGDRVVGWFGTDDEDSLDDDTRDAVLALDRLGGSFPFPTYEAILAADPDLVVSYGFNDEAGFSTEALQADGIGSYSFTEACPDASASLDTFFDDVANLGIILAVEEEANGLVDNWRAEIDALAAPEGDEPVSVFLSGSPDAADSFTSGGGSLADDLIQLAGGVNVFGDTDEGFLAPAWEEVLARDPVVIIDGSGGGQQALDDLRSYLESDPALSQMTAVQDGSFGTIRFQQNVPGPQAVDGVRAISEILAAARG